MKISRLCLAAAAPAVATAIAVTPSPSAGALRMAGVVTEGVVTGPSAAHAPGAAVAARPVGGPAQVRAACGPARAGQVRCLALYAPQASVNAAIAARAAGKQVPAAAATPKGWGPAAIEAAYRLPVSRNTHQTVAVVDAMSTPHLASDLAVYRTHYGLPPCTVASKCLRIVNQQGNASPLPRPDPAGWGIEETLDEAMVAAACPHCRIVVVEARSPSFVNIAAAEDTAAELGAQVISNSYGTPETGLSQAFARAYDHPGHTIVASSGDLGFTAANFPANLATVTAAGGTQLARARNKRGWSERAWHVPFGATGSGCSAYVSKPTWQHDNHCGTRTVADAAAVAWNIPIYDSSLPKGFGGPWLTVGGTSASAPLIAGVYALAGNATTIPPGYTYHHASHLFDITVGANALFASPARTCGNDYLCTAKPGYDAPTGLGTPNGIGGF